MKQLLLLVLTFSLTFLTGCTQDIYIEPNAISIVYENARYEGDNFLIDVYITNGYDSDRYVEYMEFDIYSDEEKDLYIAGAGFDILTTIPSFDYIMVELEFEKEFVFTNESAFKQSNYKLDNVVLYFYIEE